MIAPDGRSGSWATSSVGVILVDVEDGAKEAVVGYAPPVLRQRWGQQEQYIDLVEQVAVAIGVDAFQDRIRSRDVTWFEDNTGVFSGMVKCCCRRPELDGAMAAVWHSQWYTPGCDTTMMRVMPIGSTDLAESSRPMHGFVRKGFRFTPPRPLHGLGVSTQATECHSR